MQACKWPDCGKLFEPRFGKGRPGRGRAELFCSNRCRVAHYASQRVFDAIKMRAWYILRTYNLSTEQWRELFASQGSRCALCLTDKPGSVKGWATDHDHDTGRVRGILCHSCNRFLGMYEALRKNPRVEPYLEATREPKVSATA